MGLRRADIDLETASVSIERSAVELGTRIVVKAPKTAAGVRSVALPAWLVPELRTHLDTFADPGPDGRVFVGLYGATPLRRNFATIWKRAKASAGVPAELHFHDLRHTGNHFAAASGRASTRELMGRMGHASMRAALIYQHRTAERDRATCGCPRRHAPSGGVAPLWARSGHAGRRGVLFDSAALLQNLL